MKCKIRKFIVLFLIQVFFIMDFGCAGEIFSSVQRNCLSPALSINKDGFQILLSRLHSNPIIIDSSLIAQLKQLEEDTKTLLRQRLKPITKQKVLSLHNEVIIKLGKLEKFTSSTGNSDMLIKNQQADKELFITLIAKMIPASGNKKPSIKRAKSFIYIGDKSYEIVEDGIIDELSLEKFYFLRTKERMLNIDLLKITGNRQLDEFLGKTFKDDNSLEISPEFLNFSINAIKQSV